MIRADIYSAIDYLHQKKIVDRLRFSALPIRLFLNESSLISKQWKKIDKINAPWFELSFRGALVTPCGL
jgi:hypothetical protein